MVVVVVVCFRRCLNGVFFRLTLSMYVFYGVYSFFLLYAGFCELECLFLSMFELYVLLMDVVLFCCWFIFRPS